jgi:hypothetical protein
LLGALFDGIKWLITAPLAILSGVAGWVSEALSSGLTSPEDIAEHVRRRIFAQPAPDIHFDLVLKAGNVVVHDFGRITLDAGSVLRAIAGAVLGDGALRSGMSNAGTSQADKNAAESEREPLQKIYEDEVQARDTMAAVVTRKPLEVEIISPDENSIHLLRTGISIRIGGANGTFVDTAFAIGPRVRIMVNGEPLPFTPANWVVGRDEISLDGTIWTAPQMFRPFQPQPPAAVLESVQSTRRTGLGALLTSGGREFLVTPLRRVPGRGAETFRIRARETAAASDPRVFAAITSVRSELQADGTVTLTQPAVTVPPRPPRPRPEPGAPAFFDIPTMEGRAGLNVVSVSVTDGAGQVAGAARIFYLRNE